MTRMVVFDRLETPLGPLLVVTAEGRLCGADFAASDKEEARSWRLLERFLGPLSRVAGACPEAVRSAFADYFDGRVRALATLPLVTQGTAFQEAVWQALRQTRAGERLSYGEMAVRLGRPAAQRAVGHANGRNPIAVAIPCHRLLGSKGELTGYAGGLERKAWLLAHEQTQGRF